MTDMHSWFNGDSLSLYIHIPFCVKKCIYCDFLSFSYSVDEADIYFHALFKEIDKWSGVLGTRMANIRTVYIGGGTPTCVGETSLARLLEKVHSCFNVNPDAEITVEANPGTINREKLDVLKSAGVNRLSLGIQSFNDDLLRCLGRIHTGDEGRKAIDLVIAAGFENFNLDFIFGIPGETEELWLKDLEEAVSYEPTHISAYDLIVEENTPLFDLVENGKLKLPGEEFSRKLYESVIAKLGSYGYRHYEISNFARAGFECIHNKVYWTNGDYLGVGLSACSSASGRRWRNHSSFSEYVQKSLKRFPIQEMEVLSIPVQMWETVFMGLRMLREGVSFSGFCDRFGFDLDEVYQEEMSRLEQLGFIKLLDDRMILSEKGLFVANQIFAEFAPY